METEPVGKFLSSCGEVIFRYPRFEDWEGMLKAINSLVEERAYIGRWTIKGENEQKEDTGKVLKAIERKESVGLVAEMYEKLIGWAVISQDEEDSGAGILGFIFLVKEARGLYIAENLLSAAISEAERVLRIKRITLETCVPNERAIWLYRKCGFEEIPLRIGAEKTRRHYGSVVARMRMEKKL